MPDEPEIETLKQLNARLTQILDDPHPGLFTWCCARNDLIKKMYIEIGGTV